MKYTAKGGVLRISKGASILMKGQKWRNLYVLNGSTVVGVASADSSLIVMSSGLTQFWHMWFWQTIPVVKFSIAWA